MRRDPSEIDDAGLARVNAMIDRVKAAGLAEEAETLENAYWGWLRIVGAYVNAHPYVEKPDPGYTPIGSLCVVDYTLKHWARLIPGSPTLDDQGVRERDDLDEAWHRAEDLRMRREAGDDI